MTIDKSLLKTRFSANFHSYNALAVVQQEICAQLAEMIERSCTRQLTKGVEIGAGTGFLTRHLTELHPETAWTINDLAEASEPFLSPYNHHGKLSYLWGDAEAITLPEGIDLLASASTIQWFDHIPEFIERCYRALKQGGYIALSTFGPDNFHEIKATTNEGLTYYSSEELSVQLSEHGFNVIETLEYTKQLHFDSPTEVLRHIKATGVNSIQKQRWNRRNLIDFETSYRERFSIGNSPNAPVSLTYHPILVIAGKRD